jgi:hypothetical protein
MSHYPPLRSTIEVYEVGAEKRSCEATTDDSNYFMGVRAT